MRTLVSGAIFTVLGAAIWFYSGTFPVQPEGYPGPSLFPRVIAGGLVLSSMALIAEGFRLRKRQEEAILIPEWAGILRLVAGIAVVLIYPWVQGVLGTIAALSVVGLVMAVTLRVRLLVALVTAVASAALIYVVFNQLLGVPL
jgi:putative tricarboxylic transport membrane protein